MLKNLNSAIWSRSNLVVGRVWMESEPGISLYGLVFALTVWRSRSQSKKHWSNIQTLQKKSWNTSVILCKRADKIRIWNAPNLLYFDICYSCLSAALQLCERTTDFFRLSPLPPSPRFFTQKNRKANRELLRPPLQYRSGICVIQREPVRHTTVFLQKNSQVFVE